MRPISWVGKLVEAFHLLCFHTQHVRNWNTRERTYGVSCTTEGLCPARVSSLDSLKESRALGFRSRVLFLSSQFSFSHREFSAWDALLGRKTIPPKSMHAASKDKHVEQLLYGWILSRFKLRLGCHFPSRKGSVPAHGWKSPCRPGVVLGCWCIKCAILSGGSKGV